MPASSSAQVAPTAFAAAGFFGLLSVGLSQGPKAWWVEYVGLGFHSALLPLATQLPAPVWARTMGYAWVAVDNTVAVATLTGLAPQVARSIRLGGHVLGATWIAGAAQALPTPARWLGRAAALCLGGHSLLAPLPAYKQRPLLLYAGGPLLLGWLLVVGGLGGLVQHSKP